MQLPPHAPPSLVPGSKAWPRKFSVSSLSPQCTPLWREAGEEVHREVVYHSRLEDEGKEALWWSGECVECVRVCEYVCEGECVCDQIIIFLADVISRLS